MRVWLPFLQGGSGADVYTLLLRDELRRLGVDVVVTKVSGVWQFAPQPLRFVQMPPGTDAVVANSWNAFAFGRPGVHLVAVEHHVVHDPSYGPYRSAAQSLFHSQLVRRYELASFRRADAVVAVSRYTARSVEALFAGVQCRTLLNAVDTGFFCPSDGRRGRSSGPFRILFAGNLSRRKGADLLLPILDSLGTGYEIAYTTGLRNKDPFSRIPGMRCLGSLDRLGMREAYRAADVTLVPSRLEGFGYAAAESLACGTPVVCSDASSLPEIVEDGVNGRLCPVDDVDRFAAAIRNIVQDAGAAEAMSLRARETAIRRFSLDRWGGEFIRLISEVVS